MSAWLDLYPLLTEVAMNLSYLRLRVNVSKVLCNRFD
jgi:hypothetical protein